MFLKRKRPGTHESPGPLKLIKSRAFPSNQPTEKPTERSPVWVSIDSHDRAKPEHD